MRIDGNRLIGKNGNVICQFRSSILQAIYTNSKIFLLLDDEELYTKDEINRNILCTDKKGKVLWKIPEFSPVYDKSPFVNISQEGNRIIAINHDGNEYSIDSENFDVKFRRYLK